MNPPYNIQISTAATNVSGRYEDNRIATTDFTFSWQFDGPLADWDFEYITASGQAWNTATRITNTNVTVPYYKGSNRYFAVRAVDMVLPYESPTAAAVKTFNFTWEYPEVTAVSVVSPSGIVEGTVIETDLAQVPTNLEWTSGSGPDSIITKILPPLADQEAQKTFGQYVAVGGDYLVVSARGPSEGSGIRETYVYVKQSGQWGNPFSLGAFYGKIATDGVFIVIGDTQTGAYVWKRTGTNTWSAPVSLSGSANSAIVSLSGNYCTANNKIYYYNTGTLTWDSGFNTGMSNVSDAAISPDGGYAVLVSTADSIRVYQRTAVNTWNTIIHNASSNPTGYYPIDSRNGNLITSLYTNVKYSGVSVSIRNSTLIISYNQFEDLSHQRYYFRSDRYYQRTDTNVWTYRDRETAGIDSLVWSQRPKAKLTSDTSVTVARKTSWLRHVISGSTLTLNDSFTLSNIYDTSSLAISDDGYDIFDGRPDDDEGGSNCGAVMYRRRYQNYDYRTSYGGAWTSIGEATTVTLNYGHGPAYFGVRPRNDYNTGAEVAIQWSIFVTKASSSTVEMSTSSDSTLLMSSSSTVGMSTSSQTVESSSESSESSSTSSSLSSKSSSSKSSSSQSSVSSESSNFGFLEAPTALTITSITPLTKEVSLTWQWSTYDFHGNWVTPTGLILEKSIGGVVWDLITYTIEPLAEPLSSYSYTDTLTEPQAVAVFVWGQTLSYRVRAYWVV